MYVYTIHSSRILSFKISNRACLYWGLRLSKLGHYQATLSVTVTQAIQNGDKLLVWHCWQIAALLLLEDRG